MPSPVVACLLKMIWPDCSPPRQLPVLGHILVHIFVTDCGLLIGDAFPVKCLVKTEVGHDGGNYGIVAQGAGLLHVLAADVENQITVYHAAVSSTAIQRSASPS